MTSGCLSGVETGEGGEELVESHALEAREVGLCGELERCVEGRLALRHRGGCVAVCLAHVSTLAYARRLRKRGA